MSVIEFFAHHPVFHYQEFAEFMRARGIDKPATWRQALGYHQKAGRLIHIRKNLYATKSKYEEAKDVLIDPFLIAAKAASDGVIGYHSALELHGLAYTTFEQLTYITSTPGKPFEFQGQRFKAIKTPKALLAAQKADTNVEVIQRHKLQIRVTSIERTIVDVLDRPDLAGGWEEVWRSLDHVTQFDAEQLVNYAVLLNNATTIAKVGYFLEQQPKYRGIDDKLIALLSSHIPKQPHYMDSSSIGKGQYVKKWQLIVPLEIVERQWEAPTENQTSFKDLLLSDAPNLEGVDLKRDTSAMRDIE